MTDPRALQREQKRLSPVLCLFLPIMNPLVNTLYRISRRYRGSTVFLARSKQIATAFLYVIPPVDAEQY